MEFLEEYGYLIKKGDKYLANLIIEEINESSGDLIKLKDELYAKAATLIANGLFDELMQSDLLNSDKLYYPDGDKNFLAWGLVPYLLANSTEGFEEKILFEEAATLRKDGAHNITTAYIVDENAPKLRYSENASQWFGPMWNGYKNGEEQIVLWQINSEWSDREINADSYSNEIVQRDLKLICRFLGGDALSDDEIAYMVQKGYLKAAHDRAADGRFADRNIAAGKTANDKFELAIIRLKDESIRQQLIKLCNRVRAKSSAELKPLKEEYVRLVLENEPRHIQKMRAYGLQYTFYSDGLFLKYCMKELVNNGRLKLPKKEQRVSLSTLIIQ